MKFLHTSDWHLGQTFYEYDRNYEHLQFIDWLIQTIVDKEIDVLLISGDIFDVSNPSAASVSMFYRFLMKAVSVRDGLQIIVIAGNHDSPSRLEAPKPLLEMSNISIVGNIVYQTDGAIDYEKLILPIKNKTHDIVAWCIAMPFLRLGDYPSNVSYSEGVSTIYNEAYQYIVSKKQATDAIIAMGHLHTLHAEISENDQSERLIMGGVEFVSAATFHQNIAYTALGHIHKAQKIAERENIRYSGSPLPMSFSEINYKHQVVTFEIDGERAKNIQPIEIPITVKLLRVPSSPKPILEVLLELKKLPEIVADEYTKAPYLNVLVLEEGPEPTLRQQIETAIENKHVRLAKIDKRTIQSVNFEDTTSSFENLKEIQPVDMLHRIYKSRYNNNVPDELLSLFNEIVNEIQIKEN